MNRGQGLILAAAAAGVQLSAPDGGADASLRRPCAWSGPAPALIKLVKAAVIVTDREEVTADGDVIVRRIDIAALDQSERV